MDKRITALMLSAIFLLGCGEKKTGKASTDLVNITASADSSNMEGQSGKAVITFEKTLHDFGTITQGEVVEYEFRFHNTGTSDLLIRSAVASCGCTVPDYPKEVIRPGEEGKIKVKFNSEMRIDKFQKEVTITANTEPMETQLVITGLIKAKPEMTLPGTH